jgi:hypothetical protein
MADTVVENTPPPPTAPLKRADENSNIMVDSPKIPEFRIRSSEYCESFSQAKILYQENKIPDVLKDYFTRELNNVSKIANTSSFFSKPVIDADLIQRIKTFIQRYNLYVLKTSPKFKRISQISDVKDNDNKPLQTTENIDIYQNVDKNNYYSTKNNRMGKLTTYNKYFYGKVYETYVFTTEIGTINVEVMNDTEAMTPQLYQLVNLFGEKDTAVMNGTLEIKEDTNELLQMLKSKKGGKRKRRTLKKHTKRVSRRSTRGRRVNSRRK